MDTDALFREIEGIDIERKRLRTEMRKLNENRKIYLDRLVSAAQERGEEFLTYKNKRYEVKQKIVHARKGEKIRKKDAVDTLSNYIDGDEAEQAYEEVTRALRGEEKTKYVIKI